MAESIFHLSLNNPEEAMQFYVKAFDAKIMGVDRNSEDGSFIHAEMDIFGQRFAFMGHESEAVTGNTMFIFFRFKNVGEEALVKKAYKVLKEGAQPHEPFGSCFWSSCSFGLIDKYGVHWCIGYTGD